MYMATAEVKAIADALKVHKTLSLLVSADARVESDKRLLNSDRLSTFS